MRKLLPILLLILVIQTSAFAETVVYKNFVVTSVDTPNVLKNLQPVNYEAGFQAQSDGSYMCDNPDGTRQGVRFYIELNQTIPTPIFVTAQSRAENVSGSPNSDYSLYLDIAYTDGTYQWGVVKPFQTDKNEWTTQTIWYMPDKPIKGVSMYLLFRNRKGKVWFRNPEFKVAPLSRENEVSLFFPYDGELVQFNTTERNSEMTSRYYFRERFNAKNSQPIDGLVELQPIDSNSSFADSGISIHVQDGKTIIRNTTGASRSITFIRAIPIDKPVFVWHGAIDEPTVIRHEKENKSVDQVNRQTEFSRVTHVNAGTCRLAVWPIAGVEFQDGSSRWIGIDPQFPAVYRFFYNDRTKELCIAYDIAFTEQKNEWTLSDVDWSMTADQSKEGFRSAWAWYENRFPPAFDPQLPRNNDGDPILGNWMPFNKISDVESPEDFGFRFMEGIGNVPWDDEHAVLTYRYIEPMTWWMHMSDNLPKTKDAAIAEVKRLADNGSAMAKTWENCVMRDKNGNPVGILLNTPWCKGCVWSMYSVPTAPQPNQFSLYWPNDYVKANYPADKSAPKTEDGFVGVDGEYIDSAEGYVTAELDFAPAHLNCADRPLTFDPGNLQPAIYRGLVTFEYINAVAKDVHAAGKSMMANSTPYQLTWLVPICDVLGTETNWNRGGRWTPMTISDLLRKRAICGLKPYCFLQNTDFTKFSYECTEKFMKRSMAFGMFPGFFSADASTGHYFSQPALYNRDRPLFKKYMPTIQAVAQAGWRPERLVKLESVDGSIPMTISYERFASERHTYVTFFNPEQKPQTVRVILDKRYDKASVVFGSALVPTETPNVYLLTLEPEDVAVWELFTVTSSN